MCSTCGCGSGHDHGMILVPGEEEKAKKSLHNHDLNHGQAHDPSHPDNRGHNHDHGHGHDHGHAHEGGGHGHEHSHEISLEQDILAKNNLLAERNRGYFEAKNIFALNLVSSPGAGKTTLLERTIRDLKGELPLSVIEGDQQTMNDANRIKDAGAKVVQVNTGSGCHLDAHMVNHAVKKLEIPEKSVLMIENVGNLVCPALFDLGETKRVVIVSVTEGDDKPQKYPYIFENADLCIINKVDLLPYVEFDMEQFRKYASHLNKQLKYLDLSATKGTRMETWYQWLKANTHG